MISERTLQAWLDERLRQAIQLASPDTLFSDQDETGRAAQMATLSAQITSLEARIRRAVGRQLEVETNDPLYAIYQVEITQANSELKAHKTTLDDLMRRSLSTGRESRERQEAFADLRNLTLDGFWQAEPRVINQLLHRLMGHRRLVVRDGQIIGTTGAPDLRRRHSSD